MTRSGEKRSRAGAFVVAAGVTFALLLLIVASAAGRSPWTRTDPPAETGPTVHETLDPAPYEEPPMPATPAIDQFIASMDPVLLRTILISVVVLVALGFAFLVVRAWRASSRAKRDRVDLVGSVAVEDDPILDAETVAGGIDEARRTLDSDAPTGDLIIAAWLVLERAAADSGAPRLASQTPTEFTSVVLQRSPADAAAMERLLDLYSRARFSTSPLPSGAVDEARAALAAIAESWPAVEVSR